MAIGIDYTAGIPHTNGAPVHDPGTNGSKQAYDHVNRVKYKHVSGTTWEVDASGGGGGGDGNGIYDGSGTVPNDSRQLYNASGYGYIIKNVVDDPEDMFVSADLLLTPDADVSTWETATIAELTDCNNAAGLIYNIEEGTQEFKSYVNGALSTVFAFTSLFVRDLRDNPFGLRYNDDYSEFLANSNQSIIDTQTARKIIMRAPNNMTTTERDALTPSEGWQIYNTTLHKLQVYDGTAWQSAW